MATSTIHMDKPIEVLQNDIEITPATGYTWATPVVLELTRNVYYVHLNITGDYPASSISVLGNMKIKGKTPFANQLLCGIGQPGGPRIPAVGQWLLSGDLRIFNSTNTVTTNEPAFIDGIVVTQD